MGAGADIIFRFAPGVMLRHDKVRESHILNAPEKLIVLDEPGHAIASRIDGMKPVGEITAELSELTGLAVEEIGPDVTDFLNNLVTKGLLLEVEG